MDYKNNLMPSVPLPSSTGRLRVYLIEGEDDLREALGYSLTRRGFDVQAFANAAAFYRGFAVLRADVVVIDIGLPDEDGVSVVSHLRPSSNVGIILVTARGELEDRIRGMRSGADAYLVKPLPPEELAATIEAVGRRVRSDVAFSSPASSPLSSSLSSPHGPAPQPPQPSHPPRMIEPGQWQLLEGGWTLADPRGETLSLTTSERLFLVCLFEHRGMPVSREKIATAMGGDIEEFDLQRIDAVASRLRRKAMEHGIRLPLRAVRGTGYTFVG